METGLVRTGGGGLFRLLPRYLRSYYSVLLLLAAWEVIGRLEWINPFMLPRPETVALNIYQMAVEGRLFIETWITLKRAFIGFAISILISVPIGIGMSRMRFVKWFFDPIISIGFPAPKIAFLPVICLWFGMFDTSKIILVVLACSFPIITETYLGSLDTDKYLIWSAKNMGTEERKLLWKVILPSSLPQIFNGIQVATPISLVAIVLAEMLSGGGGIGTYMMVSSRFARSDAVFSGLVILSVLGLLFMRIMEMIRRRMLIWHEESQKD